MEGGRERSSKGRSSSLQGRRAIDDERNVAFDYFLSSFLRSQKEAKALSRHGRTASSVSLKGSCTRGKVEEAREALWWRRRQGFDANREQERTASGERQREGGREREKTRRRCLLFFSTLNSLLFFSLSFLSSAPSSLVSLRFLRPFHKKYSGAALEPLIQITTRQAPSQERDSSKPSSLSPQLPPFSLTHSS